MRNSFCKTIIPLLGTVLFVLCSVEVGFGWGFWAHKEINKQAVHLLPDGLKEFFLRHQEYITEHAIDPDMRRSRSDSLEQYNHYLDIDYYGTYPFDELPRQYDAAVAKFGADTVLKQGILPWTIAAYTDSLADAMRRKDVQKILHFAADVGHYIADAHVPLHTIVDYDGVRRGQKGIHKRWESELTERFGHTYRFPTDGAVYLNDPLQSAFDIVLESNAYADSVFAADRKAIQTVPGAKTVKSVRSNGDTVFVYSDGYYEALKKFDAGLAERRMRKAIVAVASYWYTAWVRAGKAALTK